MKHFVIVGILVVVMTFVTYFGLTALGLMPVQASAQSLWVDWMWDLDLKAMSFLLALILVPLFYSLVVFRRRKGETGDAEHMEDNTKLEVTWTVLPLITVIIFAYLGAYSLGKTRTVDPDAMVINVVARQWSWQFEYPGTDVFTDKLYLPLDRQVVLHMQSTDVIHSFWVPEFRIKQDVVPGRVTEYRITPTLAGTYKVRCAELCGASHAYMETDVIVQPQADFDAWLQNETALAAQAPTTPEGLGKRLAQRNGCQGCHSIDGSAGQGPTWLGLFGSRVTLAGGQVVTADDQYLFNSIKQPASQVVRGFTAMNPAITANLTDDQINALIAYIQSLK
jgi:cytochrome c oxidase subunit 2